MVTKLDKFLAIEVLTIQSNWMGSSIKIFYQDFQARFVAVRITRVQIPGNGKSRYEKYSGTFETMRMGLK